MTLLIDAAEPFLYFSERFFFLLASDKKSDHTIRAKEIFSCRDKNFIIWKMTSLQSSSNDIGKYVRPVGAKRRKTLDEYMQRESISVVGGHEKQIMLYVVGNPAAFQEDSWKLGTE